MFGYDTRLSMTNEEEDAEIADIEERIELNEKLNRRLQESENDMLSNKVLGVQERILDLLDRREELRDAREREEEE